MPLRFHMLATASPHFLSKFLWGLSRGLLLVLVSARGTVFKWMVK